MRSAYEIHEYSLERLIDLLTTKSQANREVIESKFHIAYFDGYFSHLNARTIIVENDYIDRDFLEDYAGYYSRCFADYPRRCTRLHFFDRSITPSSFRNALSRGVRSRINLQDHYLGFIVVKPLPETVIGRSCLRTYDDDLARHYLATREYKANLFGIALSINTMAFQEQDTAAAACATSALWSAFQSTGHLFQHSIPSPVTITEAGTSGLPARDRAFPNHGLNLEQMSVAVRSVGLEPYVVDVSDDEVLTSSAMAYLRARIPSLLIIDLYEPDGNGGHSIIGRHGVTINGYHLGQLPRPTTASAFKLKSSSNRIDKLYVNDDQVGPFARMAFDGTTVQNGQLSLSSGFGGRNSGVRAAPVALIVPLYNKIRIPFSVVQDCVVEFDNLLDVFSGHISELKDREWDIGLSTVNDFKRDVLADVSITDVERRRLLLRSWPKFIWKASLACGQQIKLTAMFDATDLEQGNFLLYIHVQDQSLGDVIRDFTRLLANVDPGSLASFGKIARGFRDQGT